MLIVNQINSGSFVCMNFQVIIHSVNLITVCLEHFSCDLTVVCFDCFFRCPRLFLVCLTWQFLMCPDWVICAVTVSCVSWTVSKIYSGRKLLNWYCMTITINMIQYTDLIQYQHFSLALLNVCDMHNAIEGCSKTYYTLVILNVTIVKQNQAYRVNPVSENLICCQLFWSKILSKY